MNLPCGDSFRSTFPLHLSSILKLYLMAKSWGLQKDLTMLILKGLTLHVSYLSERGFVTKTFIEGKPFRCPNFKCYVFINYLRNVIINEESARLNWST